MTRRVHAYIDPRVLVALGAERIEGVNRRREPFWKWRPSFDQSCLHVTLVAGGGSYIWEEGEPYDVTLASGRVTQRMRWRTLGKPTGASLPFPPLGEPACIASPAEHDAGRAAHYPVLIAESAAILRRVAGV